MADSVSPSLLVELVNIRAVRSSDLSALEWGGEYSHFRLLYKDIFQGTLRGEALMWLAELELDGVIGQLFVQLVSHRNELADGHKRAYIYGFRIQAKYRKQGVGSCMLLAAEEDLLKRGYRWLNLNVGRDNVSARRFYEQHGFQVVGPEPGRWSYIDDQGNRRQVVEPAWRMEKDMLSSMKVSFLLD